MGASPLRSLSGRWLFHYLGKGWGGGSGREGEECCLLFTFSPLVVRFFSLHFSFAVIGNSWILKWNACKIYPSSQTSSYPVQHNFPVTQLTKSLFLQSPSASVLRGSVSLLPQPLPSWTRVTCEATVLYFLESKTPLSVSARHRYFICHYGKRICQFMLQHWLRDVSPIQRCYHVK